MEMRLLDIGVSITEQAIAYVFIYSLLDKRRRNMFMDVAAVWLGALIVHACYLSDLAVKAAVTFLVCSLWCCLLFKGRIFPKLAFVSLIQYIYRITDVISGNFAALVTDSNINEVFYGEFTRCAVIMLILKIINALLAYFVYIFLKKPDILDSNTEWGLFGFISVVFLIMAELLMMLCTGTDFSKLSPTLYFAVSVLFFIMSVIVIYFFSRTCERFEQQRRLYALSSANKLLEQQTAVQERSARDMQRLRHDMKNYVAELAALYKSGNDRRADELLSRLNISIRGIDEMGANISGGTGNPAIDAVLSLKAAECESAGIRLELSPEPISEIGIALTDLSSVLSNLFDNAIEAARDTEDSFIKARIFIYKQYLSITIENSCKNAPMSDGEVLITSKEDPRLHGYGTRIVAEICNKYNGNFRWEANSGIFRVDVIMELNTH